LLYSAVLRPSTPDRSPSIWPKVDSPTPEEDPVSTQSLPARTSSFPRFGDPETFTLLQARRPAEAAPTASALQWQLDDVDRYVVCAGRATVGYIDVVGAVFVVMSGARYSRAVEVAQTLVFDDALRVLRDLATAQA